MGEEYYQVNAGEIVAVVGSSGSGKSILAHAVLDLLPGNAMYDGSILYKGSPLTKERGKKLFGREIAFIPQSVDYLDPLMKVGKQVQGVYGTKERQKELFKKYQLAEEAEEKYPFQLSGGELKRFCIARALGPETKFLICDEITTMLDVITQAQIWRLLLDEAGQRNLGMIVITHNEHLAKQVCTRIINLPEINHV